MDRIRIARGGKELGEYTEEQVRLYLSSGNLVGGDHAWRAGMSGWKTLEELGYLSTGANPPPPPPPPPPPTSRGSSATTPQGRAGSSLPRRGIQPRGEYIRESMGRDEVLLYEGKVSRVSFVARLIFCVILILPTVLFLLLESPRGSAMYFLLFIVAMPATALFLYFMKLSATELGVTDRRVIAKVGLFSREILEVRNEKIEGVQIEQSFFGRMFNYGTLTIRGSGQTEVPISNIVDPLAFRRAVDDVTRR